MQHGIKRVTLQAAAQKPPTPNVDCLFCQRIANEVPIAPIDSQCCLLCQTIVNEIPIAPIDAEIRQRLGRDESEKMMEAQSRPALGTTQITVQYVVYVRREVSER